MTDEQHTKIIEINGVKFEVDDRTATMREIKNVKIGSRVKVLVPKYGDDYEVHHGTVIGFEPFPNNPVVIIAYVQNTYSSSGPDIKFLYYNNKSKEQVIISDENDKEALVAKDVVGQLDKAINKLKNDIRDLEDRKRYFQENFSAYWEQLVVEPKHDQLTE